MDNNLLCSKIALLMSRKNHL